MIAMLLIFDLFLGCLFVIHVSYKRCTRYQSSDRKVGIEDANNLPDNHLEAYLHWYDGYSYPTLAKILLVIVIGLVTLYMYIGDGYIHNFIETLPPMLDVKH